MDLSFKYDKDYLCRQHSFDKIKMWVNALTSFYFIRAFGGHANDPDLFETRIKFTDRSDLENILIKLGVTGLTELEYFGHKTIDNNEWFITIDFEDQTIGLLRGTDYNVTDQDFEAAKSLDEKFERLGLKEKVDRAIIYNPCCVSRERYEEL